MGLLVMTGAEWETFVESFLLLGILKEALSRFLELAQKALNMTEDALAATDRVDRISKNGIYREW